MVDNMNNTNIDLNDVFILSAPVAEKPYFAQFKTYLTGPDRQLRKG